MINKNTLALLCLLALLHGSMGWRADYGYVEVRPGAHMFWYAISKQTFSATFSILWLRANTPLSDAEALPIYSQ